jgi:DNA adenine methylase
MLNAGLSSQALLLGKKSTTYEALYLSKNLTKDFNFQTELFPLEAII